MLGDIRQAKNVYIVTGYTDMRKGIRSLVPYVMQNFKMDPYESGLFLFCGKKCDRLKALLWEPDGFVLLYKVLDNGRYQWPRNEKEVKERTWEQFTSKYCNSSVIGQAPKIGSPNNSNAVLH